MIRFLATERITRTIDDWLTAAGAPLAGRVRTVAYEAILGRRVRPDPRDVWIVSDYDRLRTDDAFQAAALWQQLRDGGCRVVNHPTRSMRRYELMRTLYEAGVNAFDISRVVDLRPPRRYPVFLRRFDNHEGPATALLPDAAALERAIEHAREDGWPMDWVAIVEFAETIEPDGRYRLRSAMRIGESLFPLHVVDGDGWVVKDPCPGAPDEGTVAAERDHVDRFAESGLVIRAFELARIEYGRIDYSRSGSGIQVWEIDPRPTLGAASSRPEARAAADASIVDAMERLMQPGDGA
ncbi:MAG: hypothetical protein AB7O45_11165 [Alphaproteobacteria bacterium]